MAISAGPLFTFNESISFMVKCETQEEIDYYWEKLTADGGQEGQCGWLKDRYGLSWQIVPEGWLELATGSDPAKVNAAMQAMLGMKKLDLAELERAYAST